MATRESPGCWQSEALTLACAISPPTTGKCSTFPSDFKTRNSRISSTRYPQSFPQLGVWKAPYNCDPADETLSRKRNPLQAQAQTKSLSSIRVDAFRAKDPLALLA